MCIKLIKELLNSDRLSCLEYHGYKVSILYDNIYIIKNNHNHAMFIVTAHDPYSALEQLDEFIKPVSEPRKIICDSDLSATNTQ